MEEFILEFDKVMEEYREAYERAPNDQDREQVDRRYEAILEEAEKEMEVKMEEFIKQEEEALLKQQEESEIELKELEEEEGSSQPEEDFERVEPIVLEIQFIKNNNLSKEEISKRYNKSNAKKNGFSTTEIYKYLGGEGNPTEKIMAEYIISNV